MFAFSFTFLLNVTSCMWRMGATSSTSSNRDQSFFFAIVMHAMQFHAPGPLLCGHGFYWICCRPRLNQQLPTQTSFSSIVFQHQSQPYFINSIRVLNPTCADQSKRLIPTHELTIIRCHQMHSRPCVPNPGLLSHCWCLNGIAIIDNSTHADGISSLPA